MDRAKVVARLETAVAELLIPRGFERRERCSWRRASDWKIEEVCLYPQLSDRLLTPTFDVALASSDSYIANCNLPHVRDPGAQVEKVKVPAFALRVGPFVRRLTGEIEAALFWFDQFESPESFREALPRHLNAGSPLFRTSAEFLDSLIERR